MLQRLLERMQRPGSEKQLSPEYVHRLKNCEAALRTLKVTSTVVVQLLL